MKVELCLSTEKRLDPSEERLLEDYNELKELILWVEDHGTRGYSGKSLERYTTLLQTKKEELKMLEKEI